MADMIKHILHFLCLTAFAAPIGIASAAAPQDLAYLGFEKGVKSSAPISFDTEGFYFQEIDGKGFLFSSNGKLAFEVNKAHDLWEQRETTKERFNNVRFDQIEMGDVDLSQLVIGNGKNKTYVFVDPLCGYCKVLIQDARALTKKHPGEYSFHITVLPIGGAESERAATKLACSGDEKLYWSLVDQNYNDLPDTDPKAECVKRRAMGSVVLKTALNIKATPVMYAPNGVRVPGLPTNLKKTIDENLLHEGQ